MEGRIRERFGERVGLGLERDGSRCGVEFYGNQAFGGFELACCVRCACAVDALPLRLSDRTLEFGERHGFTRILDWAGAEKQQKQKTIHLLISDASRPNHKGTEVRG